MVFAVLLHGRKGKRAVQLWMDSRSDIGGAEAKPGLECVSLTQHKHCSKHLTACCRAEVQLKGPAVAHTAQLGRGMQHKGCVSTAHVVPGAAELMEAAFWAVSHIQHCVPRDNAAPQ